MAEELRPSEVARRLGTSTRTVQRWIARGEIPARRVGGRWRVAFDAIDANRSPGGGARGERHVAAHGSRPIRTLFIANRGEIAARIARTCRETGIDVIVPVTDGPAAVDLLDGPAVVVAAVAGGADALHPGFGFLAENADFATDVIAAGLRWVGPPPTAIRAMGDKAAARRLAARLGIATPAGYEDVDQSDRALQAGATTIGVPLVIKPAAGGGGKGMRIVRDLDRLPADLAAARREAQSAFGDDRLVLERLLEDARHIEIQVLFDEAGGGVHLGERDCSAQRRHQKVLEESPSPVVDAAMRAEMGEAALVLARAVDYVGAGTCEFLVDGNGTFTFLEMNTRLQVEHPVTELVTGRDLVADQLRIAAGESLGFTQDDVIRVGHAVEVRLYAEDADAGFLPATGRIERLRWPSGEGIRVDAGVSQGDEVGPRFDPMLAKIIAWGEDRPEALDRLRRALDDTVVLGLTTNLRFLRWLVREPAVHDGAIRTDTLERIWPPADQPERAAIPEVAWETAAAALVSAAADLWSGGWRLNAPASIRLTAEGQVRTVPPRTWDGVAAVRSDDVVHVDVDGRSIPVRLAPSPDVDRAAQAAAAAHHGGPMGLIAPMPGQVRSIEVEIGSVVAAGEGVIVLEAMKMEHTVVAPVGGRITEIRVVLGEQVTRGQVVAIVEP